MYKEVIAKTEASHEVVYLELTAPEIVKAFTQAGLLGFEPHRLIAFELLKEEALGFILVKDTSNTK